MNNGQTPQDYTEPGHDTAHVVSLRDLFIVLFKWQWTILLVLSTVAAMTLIWLVLFKAPAYQVTAKLLVKLGNEQATPTTLVGKQLSSLGYRSYDVNSEVEILSSPFILGQLVDHFGMDRTEADAVPDKLLPRLRYWLRQIKGQVSESINEFLIQVGFRERLSPREQAIFNLEQGLSVTPMHESYVIVVSLALPVRVGASQVLNKLIEIYLDRRREIFDDKAAVDFFRDQATGLEHSIAAAEANLQTLEAEAGIASIDTQKEVLLEHIALARRDYEATRVDLTDINAKLQRFRLQMQSEQPDFAVVGGFTQGVFSENMMLQLSDLMREAQRLRAEEGSGTKSSKTIRRQISLLAAQLLTNLEAISQDRQATFNQRKQALSSLEDALRSIKAREAEWHDIKRELAILESTYAVQRDKLNEASIRAKLLEQQAGNVVLIQPAVDPLLPAGMRKATLFVLIMIITLFGLFSWIVVAEFFDHRFYTSDSLEAVLGVPVIGVVPAN